jgi:hypothetical protein
MDASTVAFIKGVIAFLLLAGTGMSAFQLWIRARTRHRSDVDRLSGGLREENAQMHAEFGARLAELEERVDFAERRLVQERGAGQLPSARVPTPV